MMRPRTTRSAPDRGFTQRPNYNRRDDSDLRRVRYTSPGRYRDYGYSSSRDPKDSYNSRDYNHRDFNQDRDLNYRDYNNHRDIYRNYPASKDYNNLREYPNSRDYPSNSRDYSNNTREFHPPSWDYHSNNREFHPPRDPHNSRDFHSSRDYNSTRDYAAPNSRDFNRYRDYNVPPPRNYVPTNRNVADYEKFQPDRRLYRERPGPYDRRTPLPRQPMRRPEGQDYDYDPKRSGPLRRPPSQTNKMHKTKVFIGNLSGEVSQDELTTKFSTFGPINRIDFRRKFAFVDFVRSKDAETAIREMHNKLIWGSWLKVQPHIEQQKKITSRDPKPNFQVTVTNLDQSVSWQDLKDFARQAGDVNYASIIIKGNKRFGLIEFTTDESVSTALKDLNGKKIVSNKLELIHIPVSEFLKKLGYNSEPLVVEEPAEEIYAAESPENHDLQYEETDRLNNDTFEAEEQSKSPSPNHARNGLYQEENIETVDYN